MSTKHIRVSQIYWTLSPDVRSEFVKIFLSVGEGGGGSKWLSAMNLLLMERDIIRQDLSHTAMTSLLNDVRSRARSVGHETATQEDFVACLLTEEDALARPDRVTEFRPRWTSLDRCREKGLPVEVFFDLSVPIKEKMAAVGVGHVVAKRLTAEALEEAKEEAKRNPNLIQSEMEESAIELGSEELAQRYTKLLLNCGVPSSFIEDVLDAAGHGDASSWLRISPEDRLPLLTMSLWQTRPYLPKKELEENYEGVVQEFGRWLSTGVIPDVPDRLKTWGRLTDL